MPPPHVVPLPTDIPADRFYARIPPRAPTTPSKRRPPESEPVFKATPHRSSSVNSEATIKGKKPTVDKVQASLETELEGHWVAMGGADPLRVFLLRHINRMECKKGGDWRTVVETFVRNAAITGNILFHGIPQKTRHEWELYGPYVNLFKRVKLGLKLGRKLRVVDTHDTVIQHATYLGSELGTKPDFSIVSSGAHQSQISYEHVRTVFEAKLDPTVIVGPGLQVGVYARQILVEQPGRRFVTAFTITGQHLRLYSFDRGGVMYSEAVDIRMNEEILVYAILLAFGQAETIGVDTTISEPTHSSTHRCDTRFISLSDPVVVPGYEHTGRYEVNAQPMVAPHAVRGRATICWKTVDGNLIIKDYWRAAERTFEADYLVKLVGVRCVGQLRAYQDNLERISDIRGPDRLTNDAARLGQETAVIPDRVHCRQILEAYTGDLSYAPNPLAMLVAFRNAVEGE